VHVPQEVAVVPLQPHAQLASARGGDRTQQRVEPGDVAPGEG
jgi:hypothetical protein